MIFFLILLCLTVTIVATSFYATFNSVVPWPLVALSFTYSRGSQLCLEVTIDFQISYAILTSFSSFESRVNGVPKWICAMNVFLAAILVLTVFLLSALVFFLSQDG